ncbi:hypothetical protein, conserved [Eimeria acervulina]|uniref:Metallo-beta-lactamase domain-containing protein n=1 Tax=Eimeria acervulina TaxID=5801 RepID=U6GV98_EIMAC|nr:hypothetical protein, conserved [Eimeria acervulina]CDI83497.1 hypothetical protein, conserved [Eimeria acervulina]
MCNEPGGGNPEHPPAGGQQTRLIGASRLELYRQIALSLASFAPVLSGPVAATSTTAAGTEATPTYDAGEAALTSPAAKAASEIETAYAEVVAAAAGALSADSVEQGGKNSGSCNSSCGNSAGFSPWWAAATAKAVQAARASFLSKVADAFGLKNAADAIGVVYAHQSSTWGNAKLLVDRQLLLRRRGEQQKGSWSLHFLGTGAMQASATRGTSSILFSRGDGCAWLFDCGGGPSPTHAASACRRAASAADAAAAEAGAVGDLSSRLERAVAAAVAAEAITWTNPAVAATQQQQQQQETRKVRILHPGFPSPFAVPRLRWWDTRVLKSAAGVASLCLALSAETHGRGPAGICDASSRGPLPRPPFLSVPNSARSRGGTSARRLPSFSVVELRAVPHLHHRRSRAIRLPFLPPAPSETVGRGDIEPNADGSYVAFEDSEMVVTAAPIRHLVPCVGYVLTEKKSRHRLRADIIDPVIERNSHRLKDLHEWPQLRGEPRAVYKARNVERITIMPITKNSSSHIPHTRPILYSRREHERIVFNLLTDLKTGERFTFPDGTQVGHSDIFLEAPHPRKICFAFDTCDASRLLPFARGADIVVHEATMSGVKGTSCRSDPYSDALLPLDQPRLEKGEGLSRCYGEFKGRSAKDLMGSQVQAASEAAFERGHSSAAMAGSFAFRAGAGRLVLTHFSQRYRGDPALRSVLAMERVEEEARRAYDIEGQLQKGTYASPLKVTAAWDGLAVVLPQRTHTRAVHPPDREA